MKREVSFEGHVILTPNEEGKVLTDDGIKKIITAALQKYGADVDNVTITFTMNIFDLSDRS